MTKHEATVISVYTGFLLVPFEEANAYVEKLCGRLVQASEYADDEFLLEIRRLSKDDFIDLEVT